MVKEAYFLVVGIDFGTSFSKIIVQDQRTKQSCVVTSNGHWLMPSVVGLHDSCFYAPMCCQVQGAIPYLKILAREMIRKEREGKSEVACPPHLMALAEGKDCHELLEDILGWYFANLIAATRKFIATASPWQDFDFTAECRKDFCTYQLSVPTGYQSDAGISRLFLRALKLGLLLSERIEGEMDHRVDIDQLFEFFDARRESLNTQELEDRCYTYPEVAAAVQTVMRSPNAQDGLYLTVDVGAGTVDLNAFRRYTAQGVLSVDESSEDKNNLDYYATSMTFLGASRIIERQQMNPFKEFKIYLPEDQTHWGLAPMPESILMGKLQDEIHRLFHQATRPEFQTNIRTQGGRTWDECKIYAWGGGFKYQGYQDAILAKLNTLMSPAREVTRLPYPKDLVMPQGGDFDRLAVAYGLSFHKFNLEQVRLPVEVARWDKEPEESQETKPSFKPGAWTLDAYNV